MKIAYEIDWDVDEEEERNNLPSMVLIPNGTQEDDVADYLSDKFGFCVNSFLTKEAKVSSYTFNHTYTAKVTHEVKFELPEGLSDEEAVEFVRYNSGEMYPTSTEATDEDFLEEGDWTVQ